MQGLNLWEGSSCPLCLTRGVNSKLKFFRLNLRVAALLCKRRKCPFPLSTNYPDTFVRVGRDGKIVPGSQSERGWQHEEEDDSDDSPYISDASEESVTFPDIVPEFKKLCDVSSKNTNANARGASEVDAFDISSIDFETDDSMDTFKLRNEITSLEMEITKTVENMKSEAPRDNCKGSTMLGSNNENCRKPVLVAGKAFTSSNDNVFTDTHRLLDINDSSCVKVNENEVECCDDIKSGNIILRGHDSPTSVSGSLELSKMSEELTNCIQQSEVKIPISDNSVSSSKNADIQKNSNRIGQGGGDIDEGRHRDALEGVKTIGNSNYSDSNVGKQFDIFSVADTPNSEPEPKPSLLLISQEMVNTVGNDLSKNRELHAELVISESVNSTDHEKENCGNKEIEIIFDDHKNGDSSDNNVKKQLNTFSMVDISNPNPEPSVLLTPQDVKNTVGSDLPSTESFTKQLLTFNIDDMDIIFDDDVNGDCIASIVEKQLDTFPMADTLIPEPDPSVLLTPQGAKNTMGNDSPRKHELHEELVTSNSATFKEGNDCGNKKCDSKKMDIMFDDQEKVDVYEIVTIDSETSPTGSLVDSRSYEIINLELSVCKDQKSRGDITGRKTTKVHHSAQNTSEQHGLRNSIACADLASVTPSVKVKIVEEEGLFVCTANIVPPSTSEVEEEKQLQKTSVKNKPHSKSCVCFLCKETNKKGITSHLDRALADLFPEEHPIEKHLTGRELRTEREIMKDFVHYMTGNSSLQNTKKTHRKRKRLFHL